MKDSTNGPQSLADFAAPGFFALRTPLLAFNALEEWGQALSAPQFPSGQRGDALAQDAARLRAFLRAKVVEPVVREALFLASPSLEESLPLWETEPESERGQKVERTLVRYFSRMAARATPFGLFAAHSVGRFGEHTRLSLAERATLRRRTRLDLDYVHELVDQVRKNPEVLRALRYVPNSSLYRAGDRLRYTELRLRGHERSFNLVGVEPSPYLEATLEQARTGATLEELAAALVARDPEVALEEARSFVETLVSEQLLVSTWAPSLTGPEPVPHLLEGAREVPALGGVRQHLGSVQEQLTRMDSATPGHPPEAYRRLAHELEALPTPVELSRLFHVEAFRPAPQAALSSLVVEELKRAIHALQRINPSQVQDHPLEHFKSQFLKRYEGRAVPLLEALDEESGVGFSFSRATGSATGPLLGGFAFPHGRRADKGTWEPRFNHLLRRLESLWSQGGRELVLTPEDIQAMEVPEPFSLPEAFGVMCAVMAPSAQAVDEGRFQLFLENVHGPSGALYLGRFCHADSELEGLVREHLRAEESLRPEAVFAEIVHVPPGRMSNISCRPLLRRYDIPLLGESGAVPEDRIPLTDLWLSVEQGRLVLRSARLGREVIPRLSTAHNFSVHGLGVYRFLGMLQNPQGVGMRFSWGPLAQAAFLPRVVYGRTVLAPARWTIPGSTLRVWSEAPGAGRFDAVQQLRAQQRMPRWVCLREDDNQLLVDLDNVLCVETLVQLVKSRPGITLEELLPGPDALCVESSEGRHLHELIVPFVRQAPAVARPARPSRQLGGPSAKRRFPPGSEWLYLKLYGGAATLDRLLATTLGEALRKAQATGGTDRWFFIRYNDPETHLRLRLHGPPARLESEVWPLLRAACAACLDAGNLWRIQLDTYERELERYGGPLGMALAEEMFFADSQAVLDFFQASPEAGMDLRWRLTLKGMDALLEDLGLSLEQKLAVVQSAREGFGSEFHVNKAFEIQLGTRYRHESRALEALVFGPPEAAGAARPGLVALQHRSARVRAVAKLLRQAEQEGKLTSPLYDLANAQLHMHANRMLPEEPRSHELILHDFLCRLYRSRLARQKKGT